MNDFVGICIPLGICVALPVLIVWLVMRVKINGQNREAEIITEALRSNLQGNNEALTDLLKKKPKSQLERLMVKLGWGAVMTLIGTGCIVLSCIMQDKYGFDEDVIGMIFLTICFLGVGIGLLISFFVHKKMMNNQN